MKLGLLVPEHACRHTSQRESSSRRVFWRSWEGGARWSRASWRRASKRRSSSAAGRCGAASRGTPRRNATCRIALVASSRGPPLEAIWLELERLQFEKEARRRFRRKSPNSKSSTSPMTLLMQRLPVIEYVFPISDLSAAPAPANEYAAPALLVCRQER